MHNQLLNVPNYGALLFAEFVRSIESLEWEEIRGWRTYPFSRGQLSPPVGEIHAFDSAKVRITLVKNHSYLFQISQRDDSEVGSPDTVYDGTVLLFCTVCPNPGHLLSEIISFSEFYSMLGFPLRVAIPQSIKTRLPYMYQMLKGLCPGVRLIPLYDNQLYQFERLVTHRNRWFTFLKNWRDFDYFTINDVLRFKSLNAIAESHSDPLGRILGYVSSVYADNQHLVKHSRKLFVVKTSADSNSITPARGLAIDSRAMQLALENGFEFITIADFDDIEEYISTLRRATHVVFSYGAITCSNRFFLNTDAVVILLANLSYSSEYTSGNEYWHIRHSHLCPVRSQSVILDFPDSVDEFAMQRILSEFDAID
jgi:hypothetical protein